MTKKISDNRRARHDYEIIETFEAGLILQGWEVKTIRSGRAQITEAHVVIRKGRFFLINCHLAPLLTASTHITPDPTRSRELLLKQKEIKRLLGKVKEKGLTLVPLNLHLRGAYIKVDIALARGKKKHDKRRDLEKKEYNRQQQRNLRIKNR